MSNPLADLSKITTQDILNPESIYDPVQKKENPNVVDDNKTDETAEELAAEKKAAEAVGDDVDNQGEEGEGEGEGEESQEDGPSEIDQVIEYLGLTKEEVGEISNDATGLSRIAEIQSQKILQSSFQNFFEENPSIYKLQLFLENGGTEKEYFEAMFFNSDISEVDEKTEEGQIAIIRENGKRKGMSSEDTQDLIALWKEKKILDKKAKEFKTEITKRDTEQKEQKIKELEIARDEREKQEAQYQQAVVNTIGSGKIGVFELPLAERKAFYDWMSKPDGAGQTARSKVRSKLTIADSLALEYIIFKEFAVGGLKKSTATPGVPKFGTKKKIAVEKNVQSPKQGNATSIRDMNVVDIFQGTN